MFTEKTSVQSVIKEDQKSEGRISMIDTRINAVARPAYSCSSPSRSPCRRAMPPAGRHRRWSAAPDGSTPTTSRFSLRPILDGEGGRPYYVGGYAGASYGPGLFSRRAVVGTPVAQPSGTPSVTVDQGTWEPE